MSFLAYDEMWAIVMSNRCTPIESPGAAALPASTTSLYVRDQVVDKRIRFESFCDDGWDYFLFHPLQLHASLIALVRRAKWDLREEKEKALRLERELEGWKGLRVKRDILFNHNGDGESRRRSESGSRRTSLGSLRKGVTVGEAGVWG